MGNDVEVYEGSEVAMVSPMNEQQTFILAAMEKAGDADQLEKMLATYERMEANEAKKAYQQAVSNFKAEVPRIDKNKTVAFSSTKYKHATLAHITDVVFPVLSRHGLSTNWETSAGENGETIITCNLTHVLGHSTSDSMSGAPDDSGSKNKIQEKGSTVSYLRRYTLLGVLGLATHDEDDDGVASSEPISGHQHSAIVDLMAEHGGDETRFLKAWNIGDISELWASNFDKACKMIKEKQRG